MCCCWLLKSRGRWSRCCVVSNKRGLAALEKKKTIRWMFADRRMRVPLVCVQTLWAQTETTQQASVDDSAEKQTHTGGSKTRVSYTCSVRRPQTLEEGGVHNCQDQGCAAIISSGGKLRGCGNSPVKPAAPTQL